MIAQNQPDEVKLEFLTLTVLSGVAAANVGVADVEGLVVAVDFFGVGVTVPPVVPVLVVGVTCGDWVAAGVGVGVASPPPPINAKVLTGAANIKTANIPPTKIIARRFCFIILLLGFI
jgi:hypothetical protein